jgi:FtsZ-binding cell division protein ZapB
METVNEESVDTLGNLEQRIQRAVELLTSLRGENHKLNEQLSEVTMERDIALEELAGVRSQLSNSEAQASKLSEEAESLREERKQVKNRIEKLLGQMDLLSAS